MSDTGASRSSPLPFLIAVSVVGTILITMVLLRLIQGEETPDDAAVGRAAVAQNDALQRSDYGDFLRYTCTAQHATGAEVMTAQQQSRDARGARYVDDVTDITVTGERATATVVYHFEKSEHDKVAKPMTFARENGDWKVCSPGPR